ncbi:MAG: hypothetical protein KGH55_00890 [Nanoarchaeota archaeon]|nr:hypothetical protein [Nanoarchaeota archaeon]
MEKDELIEKIMERRQFSGIPRSDVEKAFEKFDRERYSDEEKVKLTRDFLRTTFSGFSGKKLLASKNKNPEEILQKHLSTRERYGLYESLYSRILKDLPQDITVVDLGAGVNGLSYDSFGRAGKKVHYLGIEAIRQIVELVENYFKAAKKDGKILQLSIFELDKLKKIIQETRKPRVIFLFKVIDSLEKAERDFSKKLLKEIMPLADRVIISFATESWMRRRKFHVTRKWLIDFIRENWNFIDDFELGGERYLVITREQI